jgi:hypothetical protein
MSLSGTLDDLAFAELLQMAGLTCKSGVLEVELALGTAWIGFQKGMVVRVARSDGRLDRKQILSDAGLDPDAADEAADECIQDAGMNALLEMLGSAHGGFRFEMGPEGDPYWPGPDGLTLRWPLSPQFLALEGARLGDESLDPNGPRVEEEAEAPASELCGSPLVRPSAVIVIDRDLRLLEHVKSALSAAGIRGHIFQSPADGFARFKQYLLRGQIPALVLGEGVVDPVEPSRTPGAQAFATRARSLAATAGVVQIGPGETAAASVIDVVVPPPDGEAAVPAFLERLCRALGVAESVGPAKTSP